MVWYNFFGWLSKTHETEENGIILYCDNPQCKDPIQEGSVTYDQNRREIYHAGDCGITANTHRALKLGNAVIGNVTYISVEKASRFFRKGKLKQSKKLEERAE
tara:strand:+ start:2910 stop:3218 length:309 start_codon:yes stop_codon:yes gene_type:complete